MIIGLKRKMFGLVLVWDGVMVEVKHGSKVLEIHEAASLAKADAVMRHLENELMSSASAMC